MATGGKSRATQVLLLSIRWRPAVVYRRAVRVDGRDPVAGGDCAKVEAAACSGPPGQTARDHAAPQHELSGGGGR